MIKFRVTLSCGSNDKERRFLEEQGLIYKREFYIPNVFEIETQDSVVIFISKIKGKTIVTVIKKNDFDISIEKEN